METVTIFLIAAPPRRDVRRPLVDSRCVHYRCSVNTAEGNVTKLGLASSVTAISVKAWISL